MILPPRSLRLLARLKLVAMWRRQRRRLRTVSGAAFGLLGLALFGLWVFSITMGPRLSRERLSTLERLAGASGTDGVADAGPLALVQLGCGFLVLMTMVGALNHRGLYLPKEEIERLFCAPVSRRDLVRYRLWTNLGRSLFAGVIFGLLTLGRLPDPVYGLVGVFVSILTLPIVGQATSLLAGDAENRVLRRLSGGKLRALTVLLAVGLWFGIMGLVFDTVPGQIGREAGSWQIHLRSLLAHPAARVVLAPFFPWARMITATDLATLLPWLGACVVLWFVFFELCVRIPVDFRELSLETSADVARRLKRIGSRGFGASSGRVSKRAAARPVPWLLGRGPFGAVAWLKLASIFRKARGTMIVSVAIVSLLTGVFTMVLSGSAQDDVLGSALMIAVIGAFYLCAGLRFDFRMDLDYMSSVKAWPLDPRLVFLATLLPEVLLVSVLLEAAVSVRAAVAGTWPIPLTAVAAAIPLFTLNWVAIDNAVFLLAPVRFVPGQEGALHHAGRSFVLWFLRMVILSVALGLATLAGFVTAIAGIRIAALGDGPATALGVLVGCVVLAACAAALVLVGGWCLRRFDPSAAP